MRLPALAVAVLLAATAANAQQSSGTTPPADPPAGAGAPAPAADRDQGNGGRPAAGAQSDLPVSLDRIREGLAKPAQAGALKNIDLKPDFVVRVEERDHIEAILSKLDFKSGPAPLGGLYAYEQQQQAFRKSDRPLQQPYAAFSGGELITLAIEGLMQKYLGRTIGNAISTAQRERAAQAAREEVATAIAAYCDAQSDGGRSLHLCTEVVNR